MLRDALLCTLVAVALASPALVRSKEEIEAFKQFLERTKTNEYHKAAILRANKIIEEKSCVRFRQREPEDEIYVRLTGNPGGCYANVGHREELGVHTMNLATNILGLNCSLSATIIHEWLHILGFFHMQSTYDRDEYVRVNWENIRDGYEGNFYIMSPVDNLGVEYDYLSAMHYGRYSFTKNGR